MTFDLSLMEPGRPVQQAQYRFTASPLISCLMPTRGDEALCRQAIGMFQAQTYGHRELVVMSQTADAPVARLVAAMGDPRIRFVVGPPGPLGTLRNACVAAAKGPLVCVWDDDDLHDRLRLEFMLGALETTKTAAVFLSRLTVWWPARHKLARTERRVWEGSMLAQKSALAPYPSVTREEDTKMVEALAARARIAAIDAPDLYVYRVTGRNTWDAAFFDMVFERASEDLTQDYAVRTAKWPDVP